MRKSSSILALVAWTALAAAGCEDAGTDECAKGVFTGHVTIADKSEAALYEGYTQITGNLTVACPNCVAIDELGCLASVGGDVSISGNGDLESLDLSQLIHVGGYLYAYQNSALAELDLGRLQTIGHWLTIRNNDLLAELRAVGLAVVGGDVTISDNGVLETVELGALNRVPGGLEVSDNAGLQFLELPLAVAITAGLVITGNGSLAKLDGLAALVSLGGDLDVSHNDGLPFCEVCELLAQLPGFGGEITCSANLTDDCWTGSALDCPPQSGESAILGLD